MSIILTLMWPYYDLDKDAPLPMVFQDIGWDVAKYIIAVGAVCGLSTRYIYLRIDHNFCSVHEEITSIRFHTPQGCAQPD
jgi:hypothetical protein